MARSARLNPRAQTADALLQGAPVPSELCRLSSMPTLLACLVDPGERACERRQSSSALWVVNLTDVHAHEPEANGGILYGRELQLDHVLHSDQSLGHVSAHNVPASKHVVCIGRQPCRCHLSATTPGSAEVHHCRSGKVGHVGGGPPERKRQYWNGKKRKTSFLIQKERCTAHLVQGQPLCMW